MVKYNKLEDKTINLIKSGISVLVDKHFQGISDLLEEQETPVTDRVKALFELNEVSDALKCLIKYDHKNVNSHHVNPKELESLKKLYDIVNFFKEEEIKSLNNILEQYREKIKKQDEDSKSVSVFEKIKLLFQELLSMFKSKSIESFDDEHTVKMGNTTFYDGNPIQKESKQEIHELDLEIIHPEEVLEQKVSKLPTLETIVEEDEILVNDAAEAISKIESSEEQVSHKEISIPITQIEQEEVVSQPKKQLVKPLVPQKSQKVIEAGNKIREKHSNKKEIPSYTSQLTVSLKSACEKPKISPKPTEKINTQTKKQHGKNVASKVQLFESLNNDASLKPKAKGKVESLVEMFEAQNQKAVAGK